MISSIRNEYIGPRPSRVGSEVGGMPQLIQNGVSGYLCPAPAERDASLQGVEAGAGLSAHHGSRWRAGTCHLQEPAISQRLMNSWTNPIERFAPRRST